MEVPQRFCAAFFVEDLVEYIFREMNITWKPPRPDSIVDMYLTVPEIFKFNARFARAVQIASIVFHHRCNTESTKIWLDVVNVPESAKFHKLRTSFASLSNELGSSSYTSFTFLAIVVDVSRRFYESNEFLKIREVIFIAADYLTKLAAGDTPGMFSAMNGFTSTFLEAYDHQSIVENSSQEYNRQKSSSKTMDENVDLKES